MAQVVPDLQLDIGGLVTLNLRPRLVVHHRFRRQVCFRVGTLVSEIDLLVAEQLAAANHDEQGRQTPKCWLQDGTDQRVGQKLISRVNLDSRLATTWFGFTY